MKHFLRQLPGAALCALICTLSASCVSDSQKLPPACPAAALFDYFSYVGNDDFYKTNPLADSESFYNPILPGWYSDPSVCTNGEGDYFLVTSTFSYFPGVPLFHSRDLVNWTQIGHVLDRESQLVNLPGQGVSGGIFAPAISYNPHNKTYYMITTNVGAGNFFVKTTDPFGEWSDPIMLPSIVGIDPSFFFDDNGKAYIVNNDDAPNNKPEYDGHRTIRVQEFDVATDQTVGPRKIIINKGVHPEQKPIWIEGPHMYKINGKYFLMAAEGGTGPDHSEVIFRSDSPTGPFVPWKNNPILTQRHLDPLRPNPITCAGHADLIQTAEGDWWAVFLACRPIKGEFENLGRETFLVPVTWSDDGFPFMTQEDQLVPMICKRKGITREDSVTFGNFVREDDFSSETLGLEWLTLRGPASESYSLTDVPGWLKLSCSTNSASEKDVPAFVCRRLQHHKFECSTQMVFCPETDSEFAGIMLFKDETHHYLAGMTRQDGALCISLIKATEKGNEILASAPLEEGTEAIKLKITSDGLSFCFAYSTGKSEWVTLCDKVDAKYLSTTVAGGFTGTTIGLYAVK